MRISCSRYFSNIPWKTHHYHCSVWFSCAFLINKRWFWGGTQSKTQIKLLCNKVHYNQSVLYFKRFWRKMGNTEL